MDGLGRTTPAAFQKGQQLQRYHIVEVLTPTRFGHFYLGRYRDQPDQVLIEGLLPPLSEDYTAEFLKGAQALRNLEHPHILRVQDAGIHESYPFLVTDHLSYRTFNQIYAPGGIPPLLVFLPHLKKVASALHYAHRQSVAHGDIRPENILLRANNTVLLRGFLLEAIMQNRGRLNYRGEEAVEHEAMIYAAPERIQGNGGFASDQYALAVFVYTLLCGQPPFSGSAVEIAFQKIHAPVPPPGQHLVSPGVERVLMKALEGDPSRRFSDVQAFIDALEQEQNQALGNLKTAALAPPVQALPVQASLKHVIAPPVSPPVVQAIPPRAPALAIPQDLTPIYLAPPASPPPATVEQKAQKGRKKAPEPLPPPQKRPARRKGASMTRRVFAVGMVGFAALGGVAGWYVLSRRFAQAQSPVLAQDTGLPATPITVNNQPGIIFTGHLASVNAVTWSPDGKYVASASDDTFVQVFEAASGTRKLIYRGHTEEVAAVAWSPNGQLIASAGQDKTVQVWDAANGGPPLFTYTGHTDRVNGVSWSNDSQALTSGSDDKSVQVWQAGNGNRLFVFQGHTAGVLCVGWQPDQSSTASGSWDGTLRDWATVQHGDHFHAGDQIFSYGGHGNNEVYALSWSPDGSVVASAGADQTIQISNGVDGTPVPPFFTDHRRQDHVNRVFAVALSPDGASVASGDEDGNVYVWNAATRQTFFKYTVHKGAVNAVAWSPDGRFIASGSVDTTVHVWQPISAGGGN